MMYYDKKSSFLLARTVFYKEQLTRPEGSPEYIFCELYFSHIRAPG